MEQKIERPEFVENEHLTFLDDLRESGITNMFGGAQYLREEFEYLDKQQSRAILKYWMDSFNRKN